MESSNHEDAQSRQSVTHQKRPIPEDTPFEDDDEDLKTTNLKFLRDKKKQDDTETKNPQDLPSTRASE